MTAGYELEREHYGDLQDDHAVVAPLQTTTSISQTAHAVFGAGQFSVLGRRLQIALAGRLQAFSYGTLDIEATGADHPYDDADADSPPRALTGDVSVAYLVHASGTKVRGHVGNAYRAPALYERFGGGFFADPASGQVFYSAYGDPRLRPDRYRSFDAGVDQTLAGGRVQIAASAFVIDVQSLTAFDFSGGIDPATDPYGRFIGYLNGSGGSSKGLELAVDVRPTATLRISGSYAYTKARTDEALTVPDFFIVPGVLEHTASLYVAQQWSPRVDTTFDLLTGGESYGSFFARGRTRAYRYPGTTTAGISSSVRLTAAGAPDSARLRARRQPVRRDGVSGGLARRGPHGRQSAFARAFSADSRRRRLRHARRGRHDNVPLSGPSDSSSCASAGYRTRQGGSLTDPTARSGARC